MLALSSREEVGPLASALADVLAEPLADPMAEEWIAVPTLGMHRWLALQLARKLGASSPTSGDGVAANMSFTFPDTLRQLVLAAGREKGGTGRSEAGADAWHVDHLVWAVLDVLQASQSDGRLGPLITLSPGASWYGRARRLADLYDQYAVRRPELVLRWHQGHDVDASDRPLPNFNRWQPHLWRLVRERIGEPSPPERLPSLLDELRAGRLALALPPRLAIFGVTTLPGGEQFLELIHAVAAHRDVHLFLLDPSATATQRVRDSALSSPSLPELLRAEDRTSEAVRHPLLRSWGRPYRERTILLASAEARDALGTWASEPEAGAGTGAGTGAGDQTTRSLLGRIQHDLRTDTPPAGDFTPDDRDRSVQAYACYGQARQVDVLRDAILHLLAEDPTLGEDDIVVLCPTVDQFAPLIEASFGPSTELPELDPAGASTPRLLYRISDRSLSDSSDLLASLDTLLELATGRWSAEDMLGFVALAPVRAKFGFDEEALETIGGWIGRTNVRWGFDGEHRVRWGVPAELTSNTWRAAVDRLLMGVAVSDDELGLASGEVAPLGVEGSEISLAGRFADLVARLRAVAEAMNQPRDVTAWCKLLAETCSQLFEVEPGKETQLEQLRRTLTDIGDQAVVAGAPCPAALTLHDLRRLLSERLGSTPRRPDFFRGGITISSLTPLRWLPFRVVCLLGLDEDGPGTGSGRVDGDDLTALAPRVGDRDPRAEARQALLEAVLAAGEHLIVTRTGRSLRTNREVPSAVVFAELRDTIAATLAQRAGNRFEERIETVHPLQPFDHRCFEVGGLRNVAKGAEAQAGPWSFDRGAFAGAQARARRVAHTAPFLAAPLAPEPHDERVINLAELKSFFAHPARAFLQRRLGLRLPDHADGCSNDLPVALDPLERWNMADRLIAARLAGATAAQWERHERALGTLPAGGLGKALIDGLIDDVDALLKAATDLGLDPALDDRHPVDVTLDDGTRVVGTVSGRCGAPAPGPCILTFSRTSRRHLSAWLDLMALSATEPDGGWRSVVVGRAEKAAGPEVLQLVASGGAGGSGDGGAGSRHALEVAVDCLRRGMCEPIPLFSRLSTKLYQRTARATDWQNDILGFCDGDDEANRLAFNAVGYHELLALRARADDPPGGEPGRAQRFADYLWGAVEASVSTGSGTGSGSGSGTGSGLPG